MCSGKPNAKNGESILSHNRGSYNGESSRPIDRFDNRFDRRRIDNRDIRPVPDCVYYRIRYKSNKYLSFGFCFWKYDFESMCSNILSKVYIVYQGTYGSPNPSLVGEPLVPPLVDEGGSIRGWVNRSRAIIGVSARGVGYTRNRCYTRNTG